MKKPPLAACFQSLDKIAPNLLHLSHPPSELEITNAIEKVSKSLFDSAYTVHVIKTCRPYLIELASHELDSTQTYLGNGDKAIDVDQVAVASCTILSVEPQLLQSILAYFKYQNSYIDRLVSYNNRNDNTSISNVKKLLTTIYRKIFVYYFLSLSCY